MVSMGELNAGLDAAHRLAMLVKDLSGSLGFIKSMPQRAVIDLTAILREIDKTVVAVDEAIDKFITVALNANQIKDDPSVLMELGGLHLRSFIENNRGHCSSIYTIRLAYLNGWLDRFKTDYETQKRVITHVFDELDNADVGLFQRLSDVVSYMDQVAQEAVLLQLDNRTEDTRNLLKSSVVELFRVKSELQQVQSEMLNVKNTFIEKMALRQPMAEA